MFLRQSKNQSSNSQNTPHLALAGRGVVYFICECGVFWGVYGGYLGENLQCYNSIAVSWDWS